MTPEELAENLGLKKSGKQWRGPCPIHGGTGDAFVVGERGDGKPLVHCFAGCEFRDIVRELRSRNLWPEDDKPAGPPPKKIEWAKWYIRIYEADSEAQRTLSEQDLKDYRKAKAILREAKEVGRA